MRAFAAVRVAAGAVTTSTAASRSCSCIAVPANPADIASAGAGDVWAVDADGLASPEPATLRAALGDEAFEEYLGRGRSVTTDEAFELGAALAGATSIGSAAGHPHV